MNMNISEPEYLRTSNELTIQAAPPNPHFLEIQIKNLRVSNPKENTNIESFFMRELELRFDEYQIFLNNLKTTQTNNFQNEDNFIKSTASENFDDFSKFCTSEEAEQEIEEYHSDLKFLWDIVKDLRKETKNIFDTQNFFHIIVFVPLITKP